MIKAVFPAIELPDIRFAEMKDLKGVDLIVDAVSSSKYIVGKPLPVDKVSVDKVKVSLMMDGKVVNEGKTEDVMGAQWKALLWLVNEATAHGWSIEPGQVLITGAMGRLFQTGPYLLLFSLAPSVYLTNVGNVIDGRRDTIRIQIWGR